MSETYTEKQLADRLASVPLFASTTARQRKRLARAGKVLTWKDGRVAIKQGTTGAAFFLILDGAVEVVIDAKPVNRLTSGDFIGEMALLSGDRRTADIVALDDTTVFALGRPALAAAMTTEPGIGIALLESMAARQRLN